MKDGRKLANACHIWILRELLSFFSSATQLWVLTSVLALGACLQYGGYTGGFSEENVYSQEFRSRSIRVSGKW